MTAANIDNLEFQHRVAYCDKLKVLAVFLVLAGFFIVLSIAIFGSLTGLGFCPLNY